MVLQEHLGRRCDQWLSRVRFFRYRLFFVCLRYEVVPIRWRLLLALSPSPIGSRITDKLAANLFHQQRIGRQTRPELYRLASVGKGRSLRRGYFIWLAVHFEISTVERPIIVIFPGESFFLRVCRLKLLINIDSNCEMLSQAGMGVLVVVMLSVWCDGLCDCCGLFVSMAQLGWFMGRDIWILKPCCQYNGVEAGDIDDLVTLWDAWYNFADPVVTTFMLRPICAACEVLCGSIWLGNRCMWVWAYVPCIIDGGMIKGCWVMGSEMGGK